MNTKRTAGEGRIIDEASDAAFHAPILGDDQLPVEVFARLRRWSRSERLHPDAEPRQPSFSPPRESRCCVGIVLARDRE